MAAGDPGTRKRNYSATAIETKTLSSLPAASSGDITSGVILNSISGFPTTFPYTLIIDPDTSKEEVVTVTSGSSTNITVVRGQDNTAAVAHAAGVGVRHGVSAREFKELQTHISARGWDTDSAILSGVDTHVHGIASGEGDVVGTDKAQALTNKSSITGLVSTGLVSSSATPKSYVDSILGSATAASTSAASAATSATSAATSATSAAASATAAATSASSALTSQTAAATSATSAAASATAAATSATSAAASATTASNSAATATTQAAAAATSAASASTSASSAATSATSAQAWAIQLVTPVSGTDYSAKYNANLAATSASAAATSASSAATSATAAATSATSAAASATAAATSATSAAASATTASNSAATATTQAANAATSASSALTSQTAAATSATSAAASATAAATSAASAATSATSAAASATAAAAAIPSQTGHINQYLKTDGTSTSWSAVAGSLAQPTEPSSPDDGQIWVDTDGTAPTTVVTRWSKQPAAGTTSLSGNDDYSIPLAYGAGYEQVFLNGVLLSRTNDYTATSGTTITLATATVAGDIVEVISPLQIATTDTYTQSATNAAFLPNTLNFTAGKNKIINGDFSINQRGLTSSGTTTNYAFGFDRWALEYSGGTTTMSAQAFTPGNAITGYEPGNYLRLVTSGMSGTNDYSLIQYGIEDARTLAGQTVTMSFWAKAASGTPKIGVSGFQNFPGGNGYTNLPTNVITIGTTWNRYSITFTMPSVSGKTIIAGSSTKLYIGVSSGSGVSGVFGNVGIQNNTFDFWGVQLEAGSNATAFQTATGTFQGELAACQRYYVRWQLATANYNDITVGQTYSSTGVYIWGQLPVEMRAIPTGARSGLCVIVNNQGTRLTGGTYTIYSTSPKNYGVTYTHGSATLTSNQFAVLQINNSTSDYLEFTAEL